jgi:sortase A
MMGGIRRLDWTCLCEHLARAVGYAILVYCALAVGAGDLGRRAGLAELGVPNQTLWSPKRLREYEASLHIPFAPPRAILQIDSLGILVPVYEDTREQFLNRGAGLIAGMAAPGAGGNLGIAGHRDGWFRALKDLRVGDKVIIHANRHRFVYRITSIHIVPKSDAGLLADTPDPTLTLVTCYPFYYVGDAPTRFVARALLEDTVSESSLINHNDGDHTS